MANIKLPTLSLFFLFSISLLSCSSTNLMTLRVTEPAPIYLESKGKTVGIINRTEPSKDTKTLDEIDKILSLEGKKIDAEASQRIISGLQTELIRNNGFKEVKIVEDSSVKNSGLDIFPAALSWETITKMAQQNNIDYLLELSFLDTDTKVDYKTTTSQASAIGGLKIPIIEHQATVNTIIKNGWRIYDTQNKIIVDESVLHKGVTSVGRGINPARAIEAIVGRKESVLDLSYKNGQEYAFKTLPYNIRVSRDYYVKGTLNFEIAKRKAQSGNWDGAAELWAKEVNNTNPKIAGRACYNMAISSEINGNIEKAIEWAAKSYSDYGDKLALRYINVLKNRAHKNNILNNQKQ